MKNYTFFSTGDDLLSVIATELEKEGNLVKETSILPTAWTNIVYNVLCSNGDRYIFRFPRNQFFSKKILVDAEACRFLKQNTVFNYADITLCFDGTRRPYTKHKRIDGIDLSERFNLLNDDAKDKISKNIANFLSDVHGIKISIEHPKILQTKTSDFLDELAKVDGGFYDYHFHDVVKMEEKKELVYVFGDLNAKNILLDEKDEIKCFLDYTFFGVSSRYTDLSRMNSLVDREFLDKILFYYEKNSGFKIDLDIFNKYLKCWEYVEQRYIDYMKNYHKDVNLSMYHNDTK
ncbi:MAG: phosphotransferase [Rickettsiales bacterium]|jgi:aminoglycoside phosphotransferase (APT) family kinase protein|nr:phosphotransferase [Rickettsiales bacterium]